MSKQSPFGPFKSVMAAAAALFAWGATSAPAVAATRDADPAVQRALAHLRANPAAAHLAADDRFSARGILRDADGAEHVRLNRLHKGLRVIGGDLVVHTDSNGALRLISQTLRQTMRGDKAPRVPKADAQASALRHFGGEAAGAPHAELVVNARGAQAALAWDIKVIGQKAGGMPSREHLIIDARSGALMDRWDDIQTADAQGSGVTYYSGEVTIHTDRQADGSFALRDTTRGNHAVYDLKGKLGTLNTRAKGELMVDADNLWGDGIRSKVGQSDGVDAAYGQSVTWDFYQALGRNGIADDGRGGYSRVHSGTGPFGIFYNAFWSDDCFCMSYTRMLDNDNPALVALDVVGHEMTHGVTANSAGLIYSGESGGLNEGTSDIMGSMVERFARNPNDTPDYLVGEQMFPGSPLRNMIRPSADGSSADCYYPGVGGIDVHYSSGVANHFYYLMAEGSQPAGGAASPTCNVGDTKVATGNAVIEGVGARNATQIYYRALTVYMTSNTGYAGARVATLNAAADLFGAGSETVQRVGAAWAAVNVK